MSPWNTDFIWLWKQFHKQCTLLITPSSLPSIYPNLCKHVLHQELVGLMSLQHQQHRQRLFSSLLTDLRLWTTLLKGPRNGSAADTQWMDTSNRIFGLCITCAFKRDKKKKSSGTSCVPPNEYKRVFFDPSTQAVGTILGILESTLLVSMGDRRRTRARENKLNAHSSILGGRFQKRTSKKSRSTTSFVICQLSCLPVPSIWLRLRLLIMSWNLCLAKTLQ